MKNKIWKILSMTAIFLLFTHSVYAEGLSGLINLRGSTESNFENGKKDSETFTFHQSNSISFNKTITPLIIYTLGLRTRLTDSEFTDAQNNTTTSHFRSLNPDLGLALSNPMYSLRVGYSRNEDWTTAQFKSEGRKTTENYYSNFSLAPKDLPSFSLQFGKGKKYNHTDIRTIDDSNKHYSVSSTYTLPSEDIDFLYTLNYSHNVTKTPLKITTESVGDNFSGSYDIGYTSSIWDNRSIINVDYKGNYSQTQNTQFVAQTGDVLFERTALGGLHATGTTLKPDVDVLETVGWSSLVDNDTNTGTSIDLNTDKFHNTGIWLSSEKPVDRLFIYVNQNISADITLTNKDNWKIYWSNFNQPDTWIEISVKDVIITTFDLQDGIYRYEIEFTTPQVAAYFKAVNMDTVIAPGISEAKITEVEAYGIDTIPETGEISEDSTYFAQRFNLNTSLRALKNLSFSFNYSIDRADENPGSIVDSIKGIFQNIYSKTIRDGEEDFESRVTRNYDISSSWDAHRLLMTTVRYSKTETFDNKNISDSTSNTYLLSFRSNPLPTLGTNLILTRNERTSIGTDKAYNTVIFGVNAKLYRDINMTTDMIYSKSESSTSENSSSKDEISSYSINGTIDAFFTKKLFADLQYSFQWRTADNTSSQSKTGATSITYRPGRFINFTGNFKISTSISKTTTSEGIYISWLPLPAIRLSTGYQHTNSEPGPSTLDRFNTTGTWQITKFMSAQFSFNFFQKKSAKTSENHSITANLNCRF